MLDARRIYEFGNSFCFYRFAYNRCFKTKELEKNTFQRMMGVFFLPI